MGKPCGVMDMLQVLLECLGIGVTGLFETPSLFV
jgi:hypothetical protein